MAISLLIAGAVVTFLWFGYRSVETTLVRAGRNRAKAAAEEIAGRLSASMGGALHQMNGVKKHAAIQAVLLNPTDGTRESARAVLVPSKAPAMRRVEVWTRDGALVLEIASGRAPSSGRLTDFPRGAAPTGEGISPLKRAGQFTYFEITTEIVDGSSAPLGYVRRFGELTASGPIRRLLGDDARLKIGSADGEWTDFDHAVERPPVNDGQHGPKVSEFTDAAAARLVGALAPIASTPWSVWVAYPHSVVVAPATLFLKRMAGTAALVVVIGALLAATVAARITKPIIDLSRAADAVAAGDYSPRIVAKRGDEIGRLGDAFRTMIEQLERDSSTRRAAEQALRDREASFRALFANNPLPMWVYDAETLGFLEVNGAAEQHYGYSRTEFLQMRINDIRPPADIPRLAAYITDGRPKRQHSSGWRHVLKSGKTIEVEVTSHTLQHGGRNAVLVVAQDVTERRRLEAQFLQAQKMETIGQLTGGVAHDFNNLLTAILGYAELLIDNLAADDERRADVEEIMKAGRSAESLIARLMAFSRKQIVEPRLLELNAAVRDMTRMLERVVGDDIVVGLNLRSDVGRITADPGQLEQILMNLAVNARDAMPSGGRLTIETDSVYLSDEYPARHMAIEPGEYVMLAVSDTGVGMSAEVQAHLFEPFFTTKPAGKGTGLGLASVYGIVKQNNGCIDIYSEPGHGSTFKIYLPRVAEAASVIPTRPANRPPATQTATILVAEDNPVVGALACRILRDHGYTVLSANSPEESLRVASAFGGQIDLLLSDVVMPGQSGPALAAQLRLAHPNMRVLHMSGYTNDAIVRHGIVDGTTALIQKPFTPEALIDKVCVVLAESAT